MDPVNDLELIHKGLLGHTYRCRIGARHYAYKATDGHPSFGRDLAGFVIDRAFNLNIVPHTVPYDGPHGPGLLKDWVLGFPPKNPQAVPIELRTKCGFLHLVTGNGDGFANNILVTQDSLFTFDFGHAFHTEEHCVVDEFARALGIKEAYLDQLPFSVDLDLCYLQSQLGQLLRKEEIDHTLLRIEAVQSTPSFHEVFERFKHIPKPPKRKR